MSAAPQVRYDPETHRTFIGDRELVHVTAAIKEAGLCGAGYYTDAARDRGTAVHLACQYYDEGTLDPDTVSDEIRPYLDAYVAFKVALNPEYSAIESFLFEPLRGYCGTADRVTRKPYLGVWDIKSGSAEPWHALQTAAYLSMLMEPMRYRRFSVYLSQDATYKVQEHPQKEYSSDLTVFISALNIANFKRRVNGNRIG